MANGDTTTTPSDFEVIKFLAERSHAEASLFWFRNSVFLTLSVAMLGAAFAFVTKSETAVGSIERIFLAGFGIAISILWYLVSDWGRKMNHLWISEAAKLAKRRDDNMPAELVSALTATPSQGVKVAACQLKSATSIVTPLIVVLGLSWIAISVFLGAGAFCR